MDERNFENTRDDLILDMNECNSVKLDMRTTSPFELSGEITSVGDTVFTIRSHGELYTRDITDILYYRLN